MDDRGPGDPLGAATVVNDLVFTALLDGTILALDRDDGEIVCTRTTPGGGINGWMAVADDRSWCPSAPPPARWWRSGSEPPLP